MGRGSPSMSQTSQQPPARGWARLFAGTLLLLALQQPLLDREFTSEDQSTHPGEYLKRLLSDNSVLEVNTDSMTSVEFTPRRRQIILTRGEAYFRVNGHDPRPFSVYAGDVSINADAAIFSVRTLDATVSVYVTDGGVRLQESLKPKWSFGSDSLDALITRGHMARLHSGTLFIQPFSRNDATCSWAWRRGQICLAGQTLTEAIMEINRYTQDKLVIGDPSIANIRTGGNFEIALLSSLTDALQRTFGVVAERRSPNLIVLLPRRPVPHPSEAHHG